MEIAKLGEPPEFLLVLSGDCLVEHAEGVARDLRAVLGSATGTVTLDLAAMRKIDVTFFQLLYSLSNQLTASGGHLMLRSLPPSHPVMEIGELLGFRLFHHFAVAEVAP